MFKSNKISSVLYCFSVNCLCGNRAPQDDQKVSESDCDAICVGDSSKTCGGEDRIQIYDLNSKYNTRIITINYSFVKI